MQDLDRRLEQTERLLKAWLEPESVGYGWEEARETMWRSGSFGELDTALRHLQTSHPRRFSLWWRVVVLSEPLRLSERSQLAVDETSDMLASLMPRPIRVPAWLRPDRKAKLRKNSLWRGKTNGHANARQERNTQIIYQAEVLGWSATKIANHHGLTKQRVNQILAAERGKEVAA